jgi:hypothetical protein
MFDCGEMWLTNLTTEHKRNLIFDSDPECIFRMGQNLLSQDLNDGNKMIVGIWTFLDDFTSSEIQTLYIAIGIYCATPNSQRVSH